MIVGGSLALVICALFAGLFTMVFALKWPAWQVRRVAYLASLPLALPTWLLGACLLFKVQATRASRCGYDACAYAVIGAAIIVVLGIVGFLVGNLVSVLVQRVILHR